MSEENKYRRGLDDRPLNREEFQQVQKGGALHVRVTAASRPKSGWPQEPKIPPMSEATLTKRAVSRCGS